jgi:hypothetical protein
MMCDEDVSNVQKIMECLVTRVPKIIVQRVEEIFPSLTEEGPVSGLCLCVKKGLYCLVNSRLIWLEQLYIILYQPFVNLYFIPSQFCKNNSMYIFICNLFDDGVSGSDYIFC